MSGEVIIGLKNKYFETLRWQQALDVYEQRSQNHNSMSAHDYSSDYQRALEKLVEANKDLINDVEQIRQVIAEMIYIVNQQIKFVNVSRETLHNN